MDEAQFSKAMGAIFDAIPLPDFVPCGPNAWRIFADAAGVQIKSVSPAEMYRTEGDSGLDG